LGQKVQGQQLIDEVQLYPPVGELGCHTLKSNQPAFVDQKVITKLTAMPTETELEVKMGDCTGAVPFMVSKGSSGVEVTATV
jgi:hypothetical protein